MVGRGLQQLHLEEERRSRAKSSAFPISSLIDFITHIMPARSQGQGCRDYLYQACT